MARLLHLRFEYVVSDWQEYPNRGNGEAKDDERRRYTVSKDPVDSRGVGLKYGLPLARQKTQSEGNWRQAEYRSNWYPNVDGQAHQEDRCRKRNCNCRHRKSFSATHGSMSAFHGRDVPCVG